MTSCFRYVREDTLCHARPTRFRSRKPAGIGWQNRGKHGRTNCMHALSTIISLYSMSGYLLAGGDVCKCTHEHKKDVNRPRGARLRRVNEIAAQTADTGLNAHIIGQLLAEQEHC